MKYILCAIICVALLVVPCRAVNIPILMYHDISDTRTDAYTLSPELFDEQLRALYGTGHNTVSFAELIDYVYFGVELPNKPVLLTFDDGYDGVIDYAAPIAEKYGMKISCAVIGGLVGKNGHFQMSDIPANVEPLSHTFALHDREGWDGMVSELPDGTEYESIISDDCAKMNSAFGEKFPTISSVLVYPHGSYSEESERILHSAGYTVTVTCKRGIAKVYHGRPESLYTLSRIPVWRDTDTKQLLEMLSEEDFRN